MFIISSLAIREMQTKTTLRFYLTSVKMAKMKYTSNSLCWGGWRAKGTPSSASGIINLYSHFGSKYGDFSESWELFYLKTQLYNTPGHLLKEHSILLQGKSSAYPTMFIAAFFIIVRNWKQPTCPLTKE